MSDDAVGCGLKNVGNTCYLNSLLQCLAYTAPLQIYLRGKDHDSSACNVSQKGGFCSMCKLKEVVMMMTGGEYLWIVPKELILNIKHIAPDFEFGNQEDAHELFSCLINNLNESFLEEKKPVLSKIKNIDDKQRVEDTSVISEIFGGKFLSKTRCTECGNVSTSLEGFIDISLDIADLATSLEQAFHNFTKIELINRSSGYRCSACEQVVNVHKQMTIWKAPEVMCIHLKRFDIFKGGSKINKSVVFGETLNLVPMMCLESPYHDQNAKYELYGIITHYGNTIYSGHYVAFIKLEDNWFLFDDEKVLHIEPSIVMKQNAYMLFYRKTKKESVSKSKTSLTESGKRLNTSLNSSMNSLQLEEQPIMNPQNENSLRLLTPKYKVYSNEKDGSLKDIKVILDLKNTTDTDLFKLQVYSSGEITFLSGEYYISFSLPFGIDINFVESTFFEQQLRLLIVLPILTADGNENEFKLIPTSIVKDILLEESKFTIDEENLMSDIEPKLEITYPIGNDESEVKLLKIRETIIEKLNMETTTYKELYKNIRELNRTKSRKSQSQTAPPKKPITKVGRNELCPCGSGLKYKKCHEGK